MPKNEEFFTAEAIRAAYQKSGFRPINKQTVKQQFVHGGNGGYQVYACCPLSVIGLLPYRGAIAARMNSAVDTAWHFINTHADEDWITGFCTAIDGQDFREYTQTTLYIAGYNHGLSVKAALNL